MKNCYLQSDKVKREENYVLALMGMTTQQIRWIALLRLLLLYVISLMSVCWISFCAGVFSLLAVIICIISLFIQFALVRCLKRKSAGWIMHLQSALVWFLQHLPKSNYAFAAPAPIPSLAQVLIFWSEQISRIKNRNGVPTVTITMGRNMKSPIGNEGNWLWMK